jgi:hypothetical protein
MSVISVLPVICLFSVLRPVFLLSSCVSPVLVLLSVLLSMLVLLRVSCACVCHRSACMLSQPFHECVLEFQWCMHAGCKGTFR